MTGDGELQEGQNWEALQAASHQRVGRLLVVVDRNELQSDRTTEEILALESLEAKLRSFGCRVVTCDGHDHATLRIAFRKLWDHDGAPGVRSRRRSRARASRSWSIPQRSPRGEAPIAGTPARPTTRPSSWRSPSSRRIGDKVASLGLAPFVVEAVPPLEDAGATNLQGEPESGAGSRPARLARGASASRAAVTEEYVAAAYGETLLELAAREPRLVVLDADLASDCRVRAFELAEPERFVENGIAEQDMVSMAAGMARHGLLPVVNSFASFLASRANEQIYNQVSERTKVVYAMHYAGLVPAGPGKSHQSLRDASLLAAIPE